MQAPDQALFEGLKTRFTQDDGQLLYAGAMLRNAATQHPNETAVICKDRSLTYRELYHRSSLLSEKLIAAGVQPGNRVLMHFENSIELFVAYFGIWQTGAVCVPLNTFLHERELTAIVTDAQPTAVVASTTLRSNLDAVLEKTSLQLAAFYTEQDFDWETKAPATADELLERYSARTLPQEHMCLLLYTSGTTGVPKGVMLSSKNIMTNVLSGVSRLSCWNGDSTPLHHERVFAALPLFHVFAQNVCMWMPIMIGGTIIVVPKVDRREISAALAHKPTIFFGVPALYGLLCLMKTASLESVKFFVNGGDAMPDKIRQGFAMIYGRKIGGGYGLTEASPVVGVYIENDERPTDVVGYPLAGITCQVRTEDGAVLPDGQVGHVWLKGDNVMLGYYNAPEATAKVVQDGWLDTGDLGIMRTDGMLAIRGRHKDLIISKGFNIYPQEIENVLMSHPKVFKAAVLGRNDDASGQVPVAFVALRENDPALEAEIAQFCKQHLAAYKIPRTFICREDLPMNTTGKVDKKSLRGEL